MQHVLALDRTFRYFFRVSSITFMELCKSVTSRDVFLRPSERHRSCAHLAHLNNARYTATPRIGEQRFIGIAFTRVGDGAESALIKFWNMSVTVARYKIIIDIAVFARVRYIVIHVCFVSS